MKKLSQKDLAAIETFCGEDYAKRCRAIQERQKDNIVRIVNTGMVSSGKSSLYNTLINSNEEYFPTGAARTTIKADYFDYNNISYIDTPGIDVRSEDDALAFNMVIESDIIMMIHNIRTGPLNRSEAEWLECIAKRMNSIEMCKSRIIFVISWKDTREKETDYRDLVEAVKKQVFEIVGTEIPFFEISVKKYQQGMEKDKEILVKGSGVEELKEYLEGYAQDYLKRKKKIDNEEYTALIQEIKTILQNECDNRKNEVQKIYYRVCNNHKSRKSAWKQVYDYFSMKRRQLTDLETELNDIENELTDSIFGFFHQ